jgi:hypothetical protein
MHIIITHWQDPFWAKKMGFFFFFFHKAALQIIGEGAVKLNLVMFMHYLSID